MQKIAIKRNLILVTLLGSFFLNGALNALADGEWTSGYDYTSYGVSGYDYTYPSTSGYDYTYPTYDYTSPTTVSGYDYTYPSTSGYDYTYPTYDYTSPTTVSGYDYTYPSTSGYDYTYPTYDYTSPTYMYPTTADYTYTPAVYDNTVYTTTGGTYGGGSVIFGGYGYPTYGYTTYGYTNYGGGTNTSCPSGTTLINNTCQYPTSCPSGQMLVNNVCQPITQCPTGQTLVNNVCQPITQCPSGTTLINNICQPNTVSCPSGTTLINGVCQTTTVSQTYVCPNGTTVTYSWQCPTTYNYNYGYNYGYQTCWDGSSIPTSSVCPLQYKVCPNGTSIPINQTCYFGGTTYPTVLPPVTVKFNNVVTSIVTEITNTSARCNGIGLIPNGVSSTGWFEYGETPNLGRQTAEASIGRSSTAPFSNLLVNLKTNTTYYCRAVMKNQYGVVKGEIVSFVTKSKAVSYVKPVSKPVTKPAPKKQEITCTDGTTLWVKNEASATLLNKGEKLVVLQIEKDQKDLVPGMPVSYKLTYKNLSDSRLSGVAIKVSIPQEVKFMLSTAGTYDEVSHVLSVSDMSLEPYSVGTLAISGTVISGAQIGRSIVTSASVTYTVPTTDAQDEVTAYVVNTINGKDASNTSDTGAKDVIGKGGTRGFLPGSLVEWLALFTIILIIFILARSIYASYKEEERRGR